MLSEFSVRGLMKKILKNGLLTLKRIDTYFFTEKTLHACNYSVNECHEMLRRDELYSLVTNVCWQADVEPSVSYRLRFEHFCTIEHR